MPKFAYFGTPYVSRDTLAILLERGLVPAVVVTSPDAPKGRGLSLTPSETKVLALEKGLPVLAPEKLDEAALAEIASYGCELAIVVAYGKILPQSLIDMFPLGVLNIHYSLLPKYRGASPVEAALLNGDAETGVTIQKMVFELDAGDVIKQQTTDIGKDETTTELRQRLIVMGAELLADILPAYVAGDIAPVPQDHALATRSGKMKKEDGLISLSDDAVKNWNKYRAYKEWPGTFFFVRKNGKDVRVKIASARYENGTFAPARVTPEGKSEMAYEDFARNL